MGNSGILLKVRIYYIDALDYPLYATPFFIFIPSTGKRINLPAQVGADLLIFSIVELFAFQVWITLSAKTLLSLNG
ncbi:MAG: hypothetical protein AAGC64_09880 [Bacteroidota bacterium]